MDNKNVNSSILALLINIAESLTEDPEFDGIDKIIIILSKPAPGKEAAGFLSTFSNVTDEEIMTMCDVAADAIDTLLEEKSVRRTATRRMQ